MIMMVLIIIIIMIKIIIMIIIATIINTSAGAVKWALANVSPRAQ